MTRHVPPPTKATIVLHDQNVFDSVATCLVEPGGEHMLAGFCRSLLGEVTDLKRDA